MIEVLRHNIFSVGAERMACMQVSQKRHLALVSSAQSNHRAGGRAIVGAEIVGYTSRDSRLHELRTLP